MIRGWFLAFSIVITLIDGSAWASSNLIVVRDREPAGFAKAFQDASLRNRLSHRYQNIRFVLTDDLILRRDELSVHADETDLFVSSSRDLSAYRFGGVFHFVLWLNPYSNPIISQSVVTQLVLEEPLYPLYLVSFARHWAEQNSAGGANEAASLYVEQVKRVWGIRNVPNPESGVNFIGMNGWSNLAPLLPVDYRQFTSSIEAVSRLENWVWDEWKNGFAVGQRRGGQDDEIRLTPEALNYFLGPLESVAGPKFRMVMERCLEARVKRGPNDLQVAVEFDRAFDLILKSESETKNGHVYAVHFPRQLFLRLAMADGVLHLSGLSDRENTSLTLKVKIPVLPDTVYIRGGTVNLVDGNVRVEAGVLGDAITVVARANVLDKRFDGVDFWESVAENFDFSIE